MVFKEMDSPLKKIRGIADQSAKGKGNVDIFIITAIDKEDPQTGLISDYKCSIKSLTTKIQYDDVPLTGMGLGNFKGILMYPNVDDMVFVLFYDTTPTPIIIGTLFDFFTQSPDSIPQIKRDELILINREFGAAIYMTDDNRILLKSPDPADGNFRDSLGLKRAQITLNPGTGAIPGSISTTTDGLMTDTVGLALTQVVGGAWTVAVGAAATITTVGAISIFQPSTGAGIFIDAAGNVTIKGKTVDFVKV